MRVASPVKITNEITPKYRDRKTEIIEQELKIQSNHGSKESITENTVQKQFENVTLNEDNVQKLENTIIDKTLEQIHCVLNVEKYEIHRDKDNEQEEVVNEVNGDTSQKLENSHVAKEEISPKESIVVNEKEEVNEEVEVEEEKKEVVEEIKVESPKIRRTDFKCSPCIDLTSHPSVTFVPANIQSDAPRLVFHYFLIGLLDSY